jgi:hypothetical protein
MCATPPAPTGLTIDGRTLLEVRQNETVTLRVDGTNLLQAVTIDLGGIPCAIQSSTDTEVTCQISIPPAQAPGSVVLDLDGEATSHGVILTLITVAATGDDTNGLGVTDSPYATIDHAGSVAGVGSTISIGAGQFSSSLSLTDLNLVGAGMAQTTVMPAATLQQAGVSSIKDLRISGYPINQTGSLAIDQADLQSGSLMDPGGLSGQTLTITGSKVESTINIEAELDPIVTIDGVTASVGGPAIFIGGSADASAGSVSITHSSISAGMALHVNHDFPTITFTDDTIITTGFGVGDFRATQQQPIDATGTQVNSMTALSGQLITGPATMSPYCTIQNATQIQF